MHEMRVSLVPEKSKKETEELRELSVPVFLETATKEVASATGDTRMRIVHLLFIVLVMCVSTPLYAQQGYLSETLSGSVADPPDIQYPWAFESDGNRESYLVIKNKTAGSNANTGIQLYSDSPTEDNSAVILNTSSLYPRYGLLGPSQGVFTTGRANAGMLIANQAGGVVQFANGGFLESNLRLTIGDGICIGPSPCPDPGLGNVAIYGTLILNGRAFH